MAHGIVFSSEFVEIDHIKKRQEICLSFPRYYIYFFEYRICFVYFLFGYLAVFFLTIPYEVLFF